MWEERVCPLEIDRHRSQTQFELAQESAIGDLYESLGSPRPLVRQTFPQIGWDRDLSSQVLETVETRAMLEIVSQDNIEFQSSTGRTAQGQVGLMGGNDGRAHGSRLVVDGKRGHSLL